MKNNEEAKIRMQKRFESFDNCKTFEELGLNIWPIRSEEYSCSAKNKRDLFIEWCHHFKNKTKCPNFNHKSPKEIAEDIWKPNWDESDGLFQGLREHLILSINKIAKMNNYENLIMDKLQGNTPKEKYEFLEKIMIEYNVGDTVKIVAFVDNHQRVGKVVKIERETIRVDFDDNWCTYSKNEIEKL